MALHGTSGNSHGPGEMSSYRGSPRPHAVPDRDATDMTANQGATDESGFKGGDAPLPGETAGMMQGRLTRNVGRDGPGGGGIG